MNQFRIRYSLLTFSLLSFSALLNASTIQEKHLESYITRCLDQWLYPHHQHAERNELISDLVKGIRSSSQTHQSWYWSSWSYETSYEMDYVEQIIRGQLLTWIQKKAYMIARDLGQSINCAQAIADRIHAELLHIVTHASYLDQGVFAGYVGRDLRDRVKNEIHASSIQPATHSMPIYPHDICCVCQESFDLEIKQIFLSPCGHDMCAGCAEQWFFSHRKTTCPSCRATVNINALEQSLVNVALHAPSAPQLY